jgi:XTP/dITP diphosphohydrolase
MELLIATHNKGKLKEYRELLPDWKILSLIDAGLGGFEVEESADTFEGNAELKARGYGRASGLLTLADDSGLAVDALNGAPGVYSARYGEAHFDDVGRRRYLLSQLQDIPPAQRTARFVCVTGVYSPTQDKLLMVQGVCEGRIALAEADEGQGFGYDPVFIPAGHEQTLGQLASDIKHRLSHRGQAAAKVPALLKQLLEN